MLNKLKENHKIVITLEDGILNGGFGEKIASFYGNSSIKTLNYGLRKEFIDSYDLNEELKRNRLTPKHIVDDIKEML